MTQSKAKLQTPCTCMGTSRSGRWHDKLCPKYKAWLDRINKRWAHITKETEEQSRHI